MTNKQLNMFYKEYINKHIEDNKIISVSGFKKYLMIDKDMKISNLFECEDWVGVRGNLEILYEDFLIEKASGGQRNSQTYTQLLNKFYDTKIKKGSFDVPVKITLDLKNTGENKI